MQMHRFCKIFAFENVSKLQFQLANEMVKKTRVYLTFSEYVQYFVIIT